MYSIVTFSRLPSRLRTAELRALSMSIVPSRGPSLELRGIDRSRGTKSGATVEQKAAAPVCYM